VFWIFKFPFVLIIILVMVSKFVNFWWLVTAKSEDVCTWLDEPLVNLLCSLKELLTGNFLFSICTTV
jgi:hypothetical protein